MATTFLSLARTLTLPHDQDAPGKRSDIGKRVNHISNGTQYQDQQQPGMSQEEIQRTVQYYQSSKGADFDAKNVYATGAFRKRSMTPDPSVFWGPVGGSGAARRARSMEGLLDQEDDAGGQQGGPAFAATSFHTPNPTTAVASSRQEAMNLDIWEEDSLWRENLRRESLRHAQSVEAIDVVVSASPATATTPDGHYYPEPPSRPPARVTRDVVYVNDLAAGDVRERVHQRRPPPVPQKPYPPSAASSSAPRPQQRQHFLGESLPPTFESQESAQVLLTAPVPDVLPHFSQAFQPGVANVDQGRVGGRLLGHFQAHPAQANYESLQRLTPRQRFSVPGWSLSQSYDHGKQPTVKASKP